MTSLVMKVLEHFQRGRQDKIIIYCRTCGQPYFERGHVPARCFEYHVVHTRTYMVRDLSKTELTRMAENAVRAGFRLLDVEVAKQVEIFGEQLRRDVEEDQIRAAARLGTSTFETDSKGQMRRKGEGMEWF